MKILSAQTEVEVKKMFYLKVRYKSKEFTISVETINGKLIGDVQHGLRTANGNYFDTPLGIRQKHHAKIKEYVESLK